MRTVSNNWIKKIQTDEDVAYLRYINFTLADGTILSVDDSDLWSNGFKFEDSVSQNDSFDIGTTIINSATVTLNNFEDKFTEYDFEGARAVCYIGLHLTSDYKTLVDSSGNTIVDGNGNDLITATAIDEIEKIRICTMTVTDAPYQNSVLIDLTLEDDMRKFDSDYSASKLSYPATRLQIVQDICNICDVTLQSTSFYRDDYIVQTRPSEDSLTCRQVLSWVAMLGCQWARCDDYGRLVLDWYNTEPSDSDYVEIDTTSGLTVNLEDVVITGVRVTEYSDSTSEEDVQPETYLEGNEGYVIEISDNKLIGIGDGQTVASIIGARVIGMRFRPLSANILTDVRLEAGDPIKITSSKGVTYTTYITSLTLQPGAYESIANNAKSATRNSATQYSQMTQIAVEARKSILAEKTNREKAIEALGTRIDESSGVYTTEEKQPDGSYVYYLHNKKTLAESDIVWKMTAEAWGVSTDGGKTYNAGMTVDGDTIVRILTAEGVNADWIKTGALEITDDDGNTIFKADMDNKTVTISGDFVTIGGKTATEAINDANDTAEEALNVASLAKNMTMQLSNDYQSIPVDKDGKYTTFPTCETTPQVMYGTSDITKSCTYTYTASDGVTGKYNSTTHAYTVTALSTDTGWVDIKATYINSLSVTKRFVLAKLYAGQSGTDGKTPVKGVDYFDGTSSYIWIRYATDASGTDMTTTPSSDTKYIGTATTTTATAPTSASDYTWAKYVGENGTKGENGYVHIAYANSADGKTDFDTKDGTGKLYIGQYTDNTESDSTDPTKYTWTLIKGDKGDDGVSYQLESNMNVIKVDNEGELYNTEPLVFSAYKVDANGRNPYSGRFALQITDDGVTWITVYTSLSDETSISLDDLNLALGADESATVLSADGSDTAVLGTKILLDFSAVRCELYASGGLESLIDQTTVQKVVDAKSLTQKQIFDILTNDGYADGLFLENGQIYFSFTYAKGGTLELGGKRNMNGELYIYNEKNNQIGKWDKDGIVVNNGTFSGTITADGDSTFGGTLSAAKGTFAGDLSAAGGTYNGNVTVYGKDSYESAYVRLHNGSGTQSPYLIMKDSLGNTIAKLNENGLTAEAGTFKGTIKSEDGTVGGWIVSSSQIKSKSGNMILKNTGKIASESTSLEFGSYSLWCNGGLYLNLKYNSETFADDLGGFCIKGLETGTINYNIGLMAGAIAVCRSSSSSKRYKDIQADMTEKDIDSLYNIQPVMAKYKDGYLRHGDQLEGKVMPMFIAEDVEEHLPEAVLYEDGQVEDWNYRVMIPAMFQMIKSQKELIGKLTARVEELERKVK